jgi:hypothetical protein
MCASSSRVRAESIGISVARIVYEFVTVGDRGESIEIQCGEFVPVSVSMNIVTVSVTVSVSVSVKLTSSVVGGVDRRS